MGVSNESVVSNIAGFGILLSLVVKIKHVF